MVGQLGEDLAPSLGGRKKFAGPNFRMTFSGKEINFYVGHRPYFI